MNIVLFNARLTGEEVPLISNCLFVNLQSNIENILEQLKSSTNDTVNIYICDTFNTKNSDDAWDILSRLMLIEENKTIHYYKIVFLDFDAHSILKAIKEATPVDPQVIRNKVLKRIVSKQIFENIIQTQNTNQLLFQREKNLLNIDYDIALSVNLIKQKSKVNIDNKIVKSKILVTYFKNNENFIGASEIEYPSDNNNLDYLISTLHNCDHRIVAHNILFEDVLPSKGLKTSALIDHMKLTYGYAPESTMKIANELYSGISIYGKNCPLITNPQTESSHISIKATYGINELIIELFGEEYLYEYRDIYNKEDYSSNEEAIRPVNFSEDFRPENVRRFLSDEYFNVYLYIFYKTIESKMKPAIYDRSTVHIDAAGHMFIAKSNVRKFDGWEKAQYYWDKRNTKIPSSIIIPAYLYEGEILAYVNIESSACKNNNTAKYDSNAFISDLNEYIVKDFGNCYKIINKIVGNEIVCIKDGSYVLTSLGENIYNLLKSYSPLLTDVNYFKNLKSKIERILQTGKGLHVLLRETGSIQKRDQNSSAHKESEQKKHETVFSNNVHISDAVKASFNLSTSEDVEKEIKTDITQNRREPGTKVFKREVFENDLIAFFSKSNTENTLALGVISFDEKYVNDEVTLETITNIVKAADSLNTKACKIYHYEHTQYIALFYTKKRSEITDYFRYVLQEFRDNSSKKQQEENQTIKIGVSFLHGEDTAGSFITRAQSLVQEIQNEVNINIKYEISQGV